MKKLLFIASIFLFAASLFALEVNEPELRVTGNETIEFINYTGPHKVIDSLEAIKRIGSDMGKTIVPEKASSVGNRNKYFVVLECNSKS